jgi:hypothetical protein
MSYVVIPDAAPDEDGNDPVHDQVIAWLNALNVSPDNVMATNQVRIIEADDFTAVRSVYFDEIIFEAGGRKKKLIKVGRNQYRAATQPLIVELTAQPGDYGLEIVTE